MNVGDCPRFGLPGIPDNVKHVECSPGQIVYEPGLTFVRSNIKIGESEFGCSIPYEGYNFKGVCDETGMNPTTRRTTKNRVSIRRLYFIR